MTGVRPTTPPSFASVRTFWADFIYNQMRLAPPPAVAEVVASGLDVLFGDMTKHEFTALSRFPIRCRVVPLCEKSAFDSPAVIETHAGCVQGYLEAVTQIPLEARFERGRDGEHELVLDLRRDEKGAPIPALARRQPFVKVSGMDGVSGVVDARSNTFFHVNSLTARILTEVSEFASPAQVAARCGADVYIVASLLDQCYQLGWVEFGFPESDPCYSTCSANVAACVPAGRENRTSGEMPGATFGSKPP